MSTELPSEADLTLGIRTESFLSAFSDLRPAHSDAERLRARGVDIPLRCQARSSRSYEPSVSRNDPHQALRRGAGRLLTSRTVPDFNQKRKSDCPGVAPKTMNVRSSSPSSTVTRLPPATGTKERSAHSTPNVQREILSPSALLKSMIVSID